LLHDHQLDKHSSFNQDEEIFHDISRAPERSQNGFDPNENVTHRPALRGDGSTQTEDGKYSRPGADSLNQRSLLNDRVMRTIVASSNDALGLLFQAVEQPNQSSNEPSPGPDIEDEDDDQQPGRGSKEPPQYRTPHSAISNGNVSIPEQLSSVSHDLLKLWNRCRFIKQGWFSAREAVTYIDL
jgi:hypothetical protein